MTDIRALLALKGKAPLNDTVVAQITDISVLETKGKKEYLMVTLNDGKADTKIKVWNNDAAFGVLKEKGREKFWRIGGSWSNGDYGVEVSGAEWTEAAPAEVDALMEGAAKIAVDWEYLKDSVAQISHPGLKKIGEQVISELGDKYRRAAAARKNHHARRGGLINHVAQMLRAGRALLPVYPQANYDVLIMGIIFHDLGKIYENEYKTGFAQESTFTAEMMGHIAMGQQTFIALYNELRATSPALFPAHLEKVKMHIVHCILSHHGQAAWGSPVDPRSPEAFLLHGIDFMDAKLEMLNNAYQNNIPTVDGMVEASYPLKGSVALPYNNLLKAEEPTRLL